MAERRYESVFWKRHKYPSFEVTFHAFLEAKFWNELMDFHLG